MSAYKISPSQWTAFLEPGGCFRRGAFRYIEGLPDPGGEGARRGTRVHGRVEDYLQGQGDALDPSDLEDSMALALAAHLPAPGTPDDLARRGVVIEGNITYERNGLAYNGRKDLEWREVDELVVTDYKTTSQFKYALTREQLPLNVQALVYADHSFRKHPEFGELRLEWLYVLSRMNPPVRPIVVEVTRAHVEERMLAVDEGTRTIFAAREEGDDIKDSGGDVRAWVNTLPYDETLTTCAKYGKEGCPYQSQCAAHGGGLNSIRTAFRSMLGRQGKETNTMGMSVESLRLKLDAKKLGIDVAGLEDSAIKKAIEAKKGLVKIADPKPVTKPVPESNGPAATDAPKFVPPTGRTFTAPPVSAGHNGVVPTPTAPPVQDAVPPSAGTTEAQGVQKGNNPPDQEYCNAGPAPKKPRGRPAKVEIAKVDMLPLPDASDLGSLQRMADAAARSLEPTGMMLLVNTVGIKTNREVILLSTFLVPVHAAIREAHGLAHYSAADYGKGRAILAEALDQYLTEHPFSYQAVFVDARTAEGADALPTLERHAGEIYRGV